MTLKQRIALKKTVENGGNATKAMREAGYSEATVNNPSNLTQSKGFKNVLEEFGLNEKLILSSLVADIKKKPQNRIRELSLAIDLLGIKKKALRQEEVLDSDLRSLSDKELWAIIGKENI